MFLSRGGGGGIVFRFRGRSPSDDPASKCWKSRSPGPAYLIPTYSDSLNAYTTKSLAPKPLNLNFTPFTQTLKKLKTVQDMGARGWGGLEPETLNPTP